MADKRPPRGSDQFPLRLPEGLRDQIKEAAAKNGRSMNAEIIDRIEKSLGFQITVHGDDPVKLSRTLMQLALQFGSELGGDERRELIQAMMKPGIRDKLKAWLASTDESDGTRGTRGTDDSG